MSTPAQPSNIPEVISPKCPHCDGELPSVGLFAYNIGHMILPAVFCIHCRALLFITILQNPRAADLAPDSAPPSNLWKPS